MGSRWLRTGWCAVLLTVASAAAASSLEVTATVDLVALRLDALQVKSGPLAGHWLQRWGFDGPIVAGMAKAFQCTGDETYKAGANLGGTYILRMAAGNFLGDEAYALTLLSQISDDPESNLWRKSLSDFYRQICSGPSGVSGYTGWYSTIDPSVAVYYLACHAVAADYVGAGCAQAFRQELIRYLAAVNDAVSDFPMMALGAATWALAQTGPLDDAPVGLNPTGPWRGKTLSDLPTLLVSHQVPEGQENAGSFYRRFDHTNGGSGRVSGYTEDAVFAVLGLVAASEADLTVNAAAAVSAAEPLLLTAPDGQGIVYEFLDTSGFVHAAYAGELLQVLTALDDEDEENAAAAE